MSGAASKSNEKVADVEDLLVKLKLLTTQLASNSSSSKLSNNDALKLDARESQLKFEPKNDKEGLHSELQDIINKLEGIKKKKYEKLLTFEGVPKGNPQVFFDIKVRSAPAGRIVMELYADTSPRLVEIFRALCVGEKLLPGTERPVGYKGTDISRVNAGVQIFGGDVRVNNCAEFSSIYGNIVAAKTSNRNGVGPGDLHIFVSYDEKANKTRSFFINGSGGPKYDYNYPLIGRVIQGMDVMDFKGHDIPNSWIGKGIVVIADCGQLA